MAILLILSIVYNTLTPAPFNKTHKNKEQRRLWYISDDFISFQNAIKKADMDGDQKVDFDEWRAELRARGLKTI